MTRRSRAALSGVLLFAAITACGHYGPPSHPEPAKPTTAAPPTPAAPEPAQEDEHKSHD